MATDPKRWMVIEECRGLKWIPLKVSLCDHVEIQPSVLFTRCEIPGANVDAFAVDVSDEEQLEQFLVKLRSGRIGGFPSKIGGIIHSAMVLRDKPLLEITSEDLEQVMAPKAKGEIGREPLSFP